MHGIAVDDRSIGHGRLGKFASSHPGVSTTDLNTQEVSRRISRRGRHEKHALAAANFEFNRSIVDEEPRRIESIG